MTKTWIYGAALALMVLTACSGGDSEYDASGVFETTEVIVSAKGTGELMTFSAEEGLQVGLGQVLGCIDTTQLHLKKQQLLSTISATESRRLNETRQLASLRQQISNLQQERRRFALLVSENAANQKQVDDIDQQLRVLQSQLSATSEQIGSNNSSLTGQTGSIAAQIAQLDDQTRNAVITSPIQGVVLAKYMEQGEYAVPGKALFKVGDLVHMRLRAYVTADQLTSLKIGQHVKVYADQGVKGRKEYAGTVTWISDKAEFTPKTIQTRDERANLVYAVKVSVKNDGLIKDGMYGDLKL